MIKSTAPGRVQRGPITVSSGTDSSFVYMLSGNNGNMVTGTLALAHRGRSPIAYMATQKPDAAGGQ